MQAVRKRVETMVRREWGGASARELLHALLEHADIAALAPDGSVTLTLDVSRRLLDALCEWEADEDDDGIDRTRSAL